MNKNKYYFTFVPPGASMTYIKEQINELEQFEKEENMNNTLRTQIDALNAVRSRFFIIASVASNGDFSLSAFPAVHISAAEARIEAKRLAQLSPGKAFVILTLAGAEMVPVSTVSI